MPKGNSPAAPQYAYEPHVDSGYGHQEGWQATEHVFRTPEGEKVVKTGPLGHEAKSASSSSPPPVEEEEHIPRRMMGETEEGYKDRMTAYAQRKLAAQEFAKINPNLARPGIDPKTGEVIQAPGETPEEFLKRKARAQYATTKSRPAYVAPNKEDTRKSAPYKVRASFFSAALREIDTFLIVLLQYPPIKNRLKKSSYFVSISADSFSS